MLLFRKYCNTFSFWNSLRPSMKWMNFQSPLPFLFIFISYQFFSIFKMLKVEQVYPYWFTLFYGSFFYSYVRKHFHSSEISRIPNPSADIASVQCNYERHEFSELQFKTETKILVLSSLSCWLIPKGPFKYYVIIILTFLTHPPYQQTSLIISYTHLKHDVIISFSK